MDGGVRDEERWLEGLEVRSDGRRVRAVGEG